jgi:hypothetical protein
MSIVEQATLKIFETLNKRFDILTDRLSKKFNIEIADLIVEEENIIQEKNNNSKRMKRQTKNLTIS